MIRRRSCIKNFNKSLVDFQTFVKFKRIKLFRSAVNYKKFFTLFTRFKRRQIMRLKHTRNWLIYLNIIKYWTDDYRISKHYVRFQYKNRFFENNSIIMNGNQLIRHQGRVYSTQDQWVAASVTNSFLRNNRYKLFSYLLKSYKSANHVHAFYPSTEIICNLPTFSSLSVYDLSVFAKNTIVFDKEEKIFDFDLLEDFEFDLMLSQIIEIYNILIQLWYLKTAKF